MAPDVGTSDLALNWDVVVIGAGPAGALVARLLASRGLGVLLVDRQVFPRYKVCGGCLNASALAVLARAGVRDRILALGGRAVDAIELRRGARAAQLALSGGFAVSRYALDVELARAAVDAGALWVTGIDARVVADGSGVAQDAPRKVRLRDVSGVETVVGARVVVAADGLSHGSLRDIPGMESWVGRKARVGVGGLGPPGAVRVGPGVIQMAIGREGYAGAVEVEGGQVNVAAAIDPAFLRRAGGPSAAVAGLLRSAGVEVTEGFAQVVWTGTPTLTRDLRIPAARRLFVVGDAAGYVEPFTGEGMAWALAGAERLAPLAARAAAAWDDGLRLEWMRDRQDRIRIDQRWCRIVARGLRQPAFTAVAVALLAQFPSLARPLLERAGSLEHGS
jgi:menaquinone-9 beta-reductase